MRKCRFDLPLIVLVFYAAVLFSFSAAISAEEQQPASVIPVRQPGCGSSVTSP
jgi:hypothetical protein